MSFSPRMIRCGVPGAVTFSNAPTFIINARRALLRKLKNKKITDVAVQY